MSVTISDWLIILATVSGPILAVQAQKFIERASARRDLRMSIFYRLMTFRATPLAPERIQALNMIELGFQPNWLGRQSVNDKAVTTAWKNLLDELGDNSGNSTDQGILAAWQKRYDELSVKLLFALSKTLGFQFSEVELKRGIYYPRGHFEREALQNVISQNIARLLTGQTALKMDVTSFPGSKEANELQEELQRGILAALSGEKEIHVKVKESEKAKR
jgi:hypothetical protein